MSKKKISRTAYLEGRELLQRLRVRFPVLFRPLSSNGVESATGAVAVGGWG